MPLSSFLLEALEQLRWINLELMAAEETEKHALKSARGELLELIQAAVNFPPNSHA